MIKQRHYSYIIALVAIFFILPGTSLAAQKIIINEIFSDPAGNDLGLEWIELYNPAGQDVDLAGWQIGMGQYFTLPQTFMPANSYLVVHWRADGQNTANELFTGTATINANLGNSSGFVVLFNSAKRNKDSIVDYIEYGKENQTWEAAAVQAKIWTKGQFLPAPEANKNQSLGQIVDGQDGNETGDWQIYPQPTPGQPNKTGNTDDYSSSDITREQTPSQQKISQTLPTAGAIQVALQQIMDDTLPNQTSSPAEATSSLAAQTPKQENFSGVQKHTDEDPSQSSQFKIYLSLAAVIILAAASGALFIYLRRKKSIDNQQNPMLPF
jgi:hypothetical protein